MNETKSLSTCKSMLVDGTNNTHRRNNVSVGSSRADKRMSIQREGLSQKDIFEQKLEQSEAKGHVMV